MRHLVTRAPGHFWKQQYTHAHHGIVYCRMDYCVFRERMEADLYYSYLLHITQTNKFSFNAEEVTISNLGRISSYPENICSNSCLLKQMLI
jgi:hypothetical protein